VLSREKGRRSLCRFASWFGQIGRNEGRWSAVCRSSVSTDVMFKVAEEAREGVPACG